MNRTPQFSRRGVLGGTAAAIVTASSASAQNGASSLPSFTRTGDSISQDRPFWEQVASLYDVDRGMANLENGYWGIMARPVLAEFVRQTERVNQQNTAYARTKFGADSDAVVSALARTAGVDKDEIAITRGATEALQNLIVNYNRLQPGDSVLYADLDYDSMQFAMEWLKDRRGVGVFKIALPEPASRQAILDAYAKAIRETPKLKLILLTHLSHRTGLIIPVKEIAAMAREKNIDVILDAAHSWGQVDFQIADLGVDFIGFNLHKWIGAPVGIGFLYIRKGRLDAIDRHYGDGSFDPNDIRTRVHTGTANFATILTLPLALKLHETIGTAAKAARLRYLRDRWVAKARALPNIEVLTPDEPGLAAGITSFRVKNKGSREDNNALVVALRDRHKVLTVRRDGVARGQCIRVSPALYTTEEELDRFVAALAVETSMG
ncbi:MULTISPECIES: aminotransferase class V-fold PLP-dependent enzyme [unclassified Bradyrhizobium]|uniref:aminotransferase class V-fold PLP-dependent enzyme n=1 Tax=unclassified Bradyrhizobium TaxID=2631580 RepID=UPI001BA5B1B8|nr:MULTISPECIES: aminotransferase class V-fold PLP-dependent enzyme [unclassified Bradyrhizobium]MBR1223739.1 aminotransferase class V-fold PLP-dependent enzyme [Bradyrhizobium sp. AUGA SZCCT0176]MBR1296344.1 aminotransferase class V-fold PLP-dependent enzyme [Bradyrhizobium sp. AUGA SZCCT0042]